jgi:hypothetical protein
MQIVDNSYITNGVLVIYILHCMFVLPTMVSWLNYWFQRKWQPGLCIYYIYQSHSDKGSIIDLMME